MFEEALFLVSESVPAGKVNGKRLAARSLLHSEPCSASTTGIVAKCLARHNKGGGDHRRAEDLNKLCDKPCNSAWGRA